MRHALSVRWFASTLAAVVLLAVGAGRAEAQTGKIQGVVTDSGTGQPIEGVQVVLSRTGFGAMTNSSGRYFILAVPPGNYTVTARRIGYGSTQTGVNVSIDATREVNFRLSSSASTLTTVRIVEQAAPIVERNTVGTSAQITVEELQTLPVRSVTEALQLQPGFTELPAISTDLTSFTSSRRNDQSPTLIRGGRGGETLFLIDDIPVNNFLFGNQTLDMSVMGLASVQTKQGFMEPQYGNALSGVVSQATREGSQNLEGSLRYETSRLGGQIGNRQDALRDYDFIEGFVAGPVPATNSKLRFVVSGRTQSQARQVLQFDNQIYNPFQRDTVRRQPYSADLFSGWRALGFQSSRDLFGKLTYYVKPQAKLSAGYLGFAATAQTLPFDWMLTGYNQSQQCINDYQAQYGSSVNVADACNTFYDADRVSPLGRPLGRARDQFVEPATPTRLRDLYTLRWEHNLGRANYKVIAGYLDQRRETCASFFSGVCIGDRIADTNFNGRYVVSGVTSTALTPTEGTDEIAGNDKMKTKLLRSDAQWQATDHHLLTLGAFYQGHDLSFYEARDVGLNNVQVVFANYAAKPWDGAVYVQDKIEYDFLTVTLGGRFEYGRADGNFFNDPIDPTNGTTQRTVCEDPTRFGLPADWATYTGADGQTFTGVPACQRSTTLYDSSNAIAFQNDMGPAPTRKAFSPRIGFAFPITETTNAFFNFGVYVQNPLYNNLYQGTGIGTSVEGTPAAPQFRLNSFVGNPRLDAERTTSYEIGYNGQFHRNWGLTAVAFSKDQSGLSGIRSGGFLAGTDTRVNDPGLLYGPSLNYTIIVNQDFQTVRGFQFVLKRALANYWSGSINYGYMQVKTNAAPPDLETQRTQEEGDIPARTEIRSDADQRHSLNATFGLAFAQRVPSFRFSSALRNSGLTMTSSVLSGFPYTPTFTFAGNAADRLQRNSGTGPTLFRVNLEGRKAWNVSNIRYTMFMRVTNLLDAKNCVQVFATTGNCDGGASPQARLSAGNSTGESELSTFFDRPQYLDSRRYVNAGVRVDF